jgi:hypothetical protein
MEIENTAHYQPEQCGKLQKSIKINHFWCEPIGADALLEKKLQSSIRSGQFGFQNKAHSVEH